MKKILSSILALATIASVAVVPATAETTGRTNVDAEVRYFSKAPTFDGVISAEEWGEKTFSVSGANAAKPGDTAPAADNTFGWYSYTLNADNTAIETYDEKTKATLEKMSYDVWLRWDQKYLYVGVVVNDPDGYYLPSGRENIWNGDCVQFRVDAMGPNSYLAFKDGNYDYKTMPFDLEKSDAVSNMPWTYATKTSNIGLGMVNGKAQAYDMADQGTGNMEDQMLLNDPKKMGPNVNPLGDENDYAALFAMTANANGDGKNVYECAVPWVYLDQWNQGQVAVGYAWGMSLVVLNGYDDGDAGTSAFNTYLTWGSGICGSQQDQPLEETTIGGSNAAVLSDKDALTGEVVSGLPKAEKVDPDDLEHIPTILDATALNASYLGSTAEICTVETANYEVSMDVAYIANDPLNPDRTHIGWRMGEGYTMIAGWEAQTKKFVVAESLWQNGINRDVPYAESEVEFDWVPGEWHNIAVDVEGSTVRVYCDGELMVEDTDTRNTPVSTSGAYQVITYSVGSFVYDNFKLSHAGVEYADYTFDNDDDDWYHSDMRLGAISMNHPEVKGECKNANADSKYGCLIRPAVNAEGKNVLRCDFCGYEEAASADYGDANGDGKINMMDATMILQAVAMWEMPEKYNAANADANGDGKVNLNDVSLLLKYIAKWEVVLGPQA